MNISVNFYLRFALKIDDNFSNKITSIELVFAGAKTLVQVEVPTDRSLRWKNLHFICVDTAAQEQLHTPLILVDKLKLENLTIRVKTFENSVGPQVFEVSPFFSLEFFNNYHYTLACKIGKSFVAAKIKFENSSLIERAKQYLLNMEKTLANLSVNSPKAKETKFKLSKKTSQELKLLFEEYVNTNEKISLQPTSYQADIELAKMVDIVSNVKTFIKIAKLIEQNKFN